MLLCCRTDWNLLSTATPAINSWLNPIHYCTVAAVTLMQSYCNRKQAVLACIMTEALEVQSIHMPIKVTFLSFKKLREEKGAALD